MLCASMECVCSSSEAEAAATPLQVASQAAMMAAPGTAPGMAPYAPMMAGAAMAGAGVAMPLMMPGAMVMGAAPAVVAAPAYSDSLHFLASTPGLFVREQVRQACGRSIARFSPAARPRPASCSNADCANATTADQSDRGLHRL